MLVQTSGEEVDLSTNDVATITFPDDIIAYLKIKNYCTSKEP